MFSVRSFTEFLPLQCRRILAMIHLKLIFAYGVKENQDLLSSKSFSSLFYHQKSLSFLLLNCTGTPVKNQLTIQTICVFVYWTIYSTTLIYLSILSILPQSPNFCSFIVHLQIWQCKSSNLVILSQNFFWLFKVLCISINIQNQNIKLYIFQKSDGIPVNPNVRRTDVLEE